MTAARIGTAALLLAGAGAALAQSGPPPAGGPRPLVRMAPGAECPTVMMVAGSIGQPVTAGTAATAVPALAVGPRSRVTLNGAAVKFAVAPGHAPAAGSNGGIVAFAADKAGRYRIGVSGPAWIDVVRGGKAVASTAHSHGDPCSPIKKMVDFDLTPGRYLIQLSGSVSPSPWVSVTGPS